MSKHTARQTAEFPDFYHCGNYGKSQILRYTKPSLERSGIVTTYQGGLLTARHVVRRQGIPGFTVHTKPDLDIAYKPDRSITGLPLGWLDVWGFDAELVTTAVETPNEVVNILGRLGITLKGDLQPFSPRDHAMQSRYIKPGVSGSPLVYAGHIVGIVPMRARSADHVLTPGEAMAVVFNGVPMKQVMENIGLVLPDKPLLSMS